MAAIENWKIEYVMDMTGCEQHTAIAYLEKEEWVAFEAVKSFRADHPDF